MRSSRWIREAISSRHRCSSRCRPDCFLRGREEKTVAAEHEVSRKAMLGLERTGGVRTFRGADLAYLPSAGNDYGFASPQLSPVREPILGTLDTRCAACHGAGRHLFTFSPTGARIAASACLTQPNQDRGPLRSDGRSARRLQTSPRVVEIVPLSVVRNSGLLNP